MVGRSGKALQLQLELVSRADSHGPQAECVGRTIQQLAVKYGVVHFPGLDVHGGSVVTEII